MGNLGFHIVEEAIMFSVLLLFIAITSLPDTAYGDQLIMTIKMCWLPESRAMDQGDKVELNIRIVTCESNEACVPSTDVEKWPGVGICQAKDSTVTNPKLVPELKAIIEYCLPERTYKESMAIEPEVLIRIAPCKSHEVCVALPELMPGFGKCQPKSEFKFDPKGFGKWIMRQYGEYVIQQVLCEITTLRNLLGEKCRFIEKGVIPRKLSDEDLKTVTWMIKKLAKYDR